MPSVDFEDLLAQADQFRDRAKVDEAIKAYLDIAGLAVEEHEIYFRARALHLAGVSAKEAVKNKESAYYRDAFLYFRQAEELFRALNNQTRLGAVYRDMGITADYAQDYTLAPQYFQKAIELLKRNEAHGDLAVTYDKLGVHFYRLGQLEEAKKFIALALETFRLEPTAGFFRATTLLDKARVHFKLGELETAFELATESLSWFEAEHPGQSFTRRLAQLDGLLAVIYSESGDKKQSEEYYDRYQQHLKTFDSLATQVIEKELEELAA